MKKFSTTKFFINAKLGNIINEQKNHSFDGSYQAEYQHPELTRIQERYVNSGYQIICSNLSHSNSNSLLKLSPFGVVWGWTSYGKHFFDFKRPEDALVHLKRFLEKKNE